MKTYTVKPETVQHDWFVIDAADQTLGCLATGITRRLRGKHKPEYTPHVDTGGYIVVINAEQVRVTGVKTTDRMYYHHSDFSGGIRSINSEKLIARAPECIIEATVKGTLPENPLSRDMCRKLEVYKGVSHPHTAQQPRELKI